MLMKTSPSRRDLIIRGHTNKYRLSTAELIGAAYFPSTKEPTKLAQRLLSSEVKAGFLAKKRLLAHPTPIPTVPIFIWRPGEPGPDPHAIKYRIDQRWAQPLNRKTVYFATKKAQNSFGGRGGISPSSLHASHDLFLTAVYLHFEKKRPDDAKSWTCETAYKDSLDKFEKVGDARLIGGDGEYGFVEILGRYTLGHIQEIHPYCESKQMPYELW